MAFLLNAYNGFTIALVLSRYLQPKSIKDLGSVLQSAWKKKFFTLLGEERHLDWIEHEQMRPRHGDWRVHAAMVCAGIGCPALRPEAYTAPRLGGQLDDGRSRQAVRCLQMACGLAAAGQLQAQGVALPLFSLFSASPSGTAPAPWRVAGLPGQSKYGAPAVPTTRFDIIPIYNRQELRIQTDASSGNLVHALPGIALVRGTQLRWNWRLEQPLINADLRQKRSDDSSLKVCLLFDMPLAKLSLVDRSVLSLARSVSGEKLPGATLCYVWDSLLPVGTVINNAYTSRVRMIVLDIGDRRLGQCVSHRRDVAADFRQAFGSDKSNEGLPALDGVLVVADSDNAGGQSLAFADYITLGP